MKKGIWGSVEAVGCLMVTLVDNPPCRNAFILVLFPLAAFQYLILRKRVDSALANL